MGKTYQVIDSKLKKWLTAQPVFFVATSPLSENGHINLSPKGHDTLRILDGNTVVYSDYGGSGIETVAHLRENQRIVIMACAFNGPPKIVRLHGQGSVILTTDDEFKELAALWAGSELGVRSLIKIHVSRISDSCGYGVPLMELTGQRDTSITFTQNKGAQAIRDGLKMVNQFSIDGLPGLTEEELDAFRGPEEL